MTLALVLAEAAAQAAPVKGVAAVANNFQVALMAFKAGGWIVALIGAAAMVGRLLVDEAADASWQRSLRHGSRPRSGGRRTDQGPRLRSLRLSRRSP